MPKKGKGKKKGKAKGDKKSAGPPPPLVQEEPPLDELSRQFYLIQISDLEGRLGRYQENNDKLRIKNEELQDKLQQQVEDQEQMITFLKKKSNQQVESCVDLEEKLAALAQAKSNEEQRFESQLSQVKEESQRALDQAVVENKVLVGQLEGLESFRNNKERIESEMKAKDALIEKLRSEHSDALYSLEKKAVLDKDRMKKDMVKKVDTVAAEFRKVSDLQMAETTKRAIRENVAINIQLQKMSDKTTQLIQENDALVSKLKMAKRNLEILEFNEKELTRRNISNQKVLWLMKEKAMESKDQVSTLQERATKCSLLEVEAARAEGELGASHNETQFYKEKLLSTEKDLRATQEKLERANNELSKLSSVMGKASLTIQASLKPVPSDEYPAQRENLLASLLELLKHNKSSSPQLGHSELRVPPFKPGILGFVPASSTGLPPIDNKPLTGQPTAHA